MKNIAVYIAVAIALIVVIVFFVYLPESMETKDEAKTAQEEAVVNNQVTLPGVDIAPGTRVVENGIPVTVVYLTNNGFSPQEVTITSGEEVRFINLTNASMRVGSRSELSSQFYESISQPEPVGIQGVFQFGLSRPGLWSYENATVENARYTGVVYIR